MLHLVEQATNRNLLRIAVSTMVTCLVTKSREKVQFTKETVKRPASRPVKIHKRKYKQPGRLNDCLTAH